MKAPHAAQHVLRLLQLVLLLLLLLLLPPEPDATGMEPARSKTRACVQVPPLASEIVSKQQTHAAPTTVKRLWR